MARITSKWPLLLVTGKPVTPEQADEIILRTCGGDFIGNDRQWERVIAGVLGLDLRDYGIAWDSASRWYVSVGGLPLHYLNNSRIYSSWIGGPHGWCDWDGRIGCGNWNIGKWPEVPEVEADLTAIAAAFPYLEMRVQLVEQEGEGDLCGEWAVTGGIAMETEPGNRIAEPELDVAAAAMSLVFGYGRERGVSPERLASAYARVLASRL